MSVQKNVVSFFLAMLAVVPVAQAVTYPTMQRTFTNSSSQQNRYLKRVTTTGTQTPTVFECATQAQLPYTAFTSSIGTYTTTGALVDKTATPIVVENGVRQFDVTLYGWQDVISGNNAEINWVQCAMYVDWNGDGDFLDAGEQYAKTYSSLPYAAIFTGYTRTITVPAGQTSGSYRMRVVFHEPTNSDINADWTNSMFTTLGGKMCNGVAYDMTVTVAEPSAMAVQSAKADMLSVKANPGQTNVVLGRVVVNTTGALNPLACTGVTISSDGVARGALRNVRLCYSTNSVDLGTQLASATLPGTHKKLSCDQVLATGNNVFTVLADVRETASLGESACVTIESISLSDGTVSFTAPSGWTGVTFAETVDYTQGNAIWFNTPTSSTAGAQAWLINDFSSASSNPDQVWERQSLPIGNGSFGGNILGSVNRERVVLNEKTLWKGGPGTGASNYWNMNRTVSASTLQNIRNYLANGQNSSAASLTSSNFRGNVDYNKNVFGTYTMLGEAYVETGISENSVTDYRRILNLDRSVVCVQFASGSGQYKRTYFASYPDNVQVWRYQAEGASQNLKFIFNTPQIVDRTTSPASGQLLVEGHLDNNSMQWASHIAVRAPQGGTVSVNTSDRSISISNALVVEFILAADTDYRMNFDPSTSDNRAFVGEDPKANVGDWITSALAMSYDELLQRHEQDYAELYDRVEIAINPGSLQTDIPTPTRLANYRNGAIDHYLEQLYFQYGRYLLISCSRPGNMPANLQGMWHNNTDGPWRVDYHNNINLQMNYWPATCANLFECFIPYVDYVRGLVKPGERTAQAYYGARGWTAPISTNLFGFTAPLSSTDMTWNYNPSAGPWLATQMWEYYDYTRDEEWLRTIGYPLIKSSADFATDLLYMHNGTYTNAPSYSPEHGTADLGATYANAVTREVLMCAISAAKVLGIDAASQAEWQQHLDKMYPYKVGRYGQLQEWYNDIDTYNDTHRHTNHLFGLHPGTTISPLTTPTLADACKETLRQRGDAATGWSMGWKLNHWARLHDGDHAYVLFKNLLKNGTADNLWDLHPPFQIDGNFAGTAGVTELFLQSHMGELNLLPALPSDWTNGYITGLRARGNFELDIYYKSGKLDYAVIRSGSGTTCNLRYGTKTYTFPTEVGGEYIVRVGDNGSLGHEQQSTIDVVSAECQGSVQYFNLQGLSVSDPAATPGVYIKRQGSQSTKILIK